MYSFIKKYIYSIKWNCIWNERKGKETKQSVTERNERKGEERKETERNEGKGNGNKREESKGNEKKGRVRKIKEMKAIKRSPLEFISIFIHSPSNHRHQSPYHSRLERPAVMIRLNVYVPLDVEPLCCTSLQSLGKTPGQVTKQKKPKEIWKWISCKYRHFY